MPTPPKEEWFPIKGLEDYVRGLTTLLVNKALTALAAGGEVPPVVFLVSGEARTLTPLIMDPSSDEGLRKSLGMAKLAADELEASHAITVVEAWGARGGSFEALAQESERKSMLFVLVESRNSRWSACIELVSHEGSEGQVPSSPVEFNETVELFGAFTGIIEGPRGRQTLH